MDKAKSTRNWRANGREQWGFSLFLERPVSRAASLDPVLRIRGRDASALFVNVRVFQDER